MFASETSVNGRDTFPILVENVIVPSISIRPMSPAIFLRSKFGWTTRRLALYSVPPNVKLFVPATTVTCSAVTLRKINFTN